MLVAVLWIVGIVGAIVAVATLGVLFRRYTFYFSVAWLLCPAIAWFARHSRQRRVAITTVAAALSFIHFAHSDWLRDGFGQAYIPGYHVEYVQDEPDESGRPTFVAEVTYPNERDRLVVTALELALFVLSVGIPYMTWRASGTLGDESVVPSVSGYDD